MNAGARPREIMAITAAAKIPIPIVDTQFENDVISATNRVQSIAPLPNAAIVLTMYVASVSTREAFRNTPFNVGTNVRDRRDAWLRLIESNGRSLTDENDMAASRSVKHGAFDQLDFYFAAFFLADFFVGTLPPSARASDRPMAMACFLLVTFFPLRPLLSVPSFRSCIAFLTLL